jgi:SdpC family antimicrobial peptide
MKRISLIALFVAACATGCSDGSGGDVGSGDTAERTPEARNADGRALFLAVYSGLGDEELSVTAIASSGEVSPDQAKADWSRIADVIAAQEPPFFENLSIDLRSGDPYQVEAALNHGSDLITQAVPVALPGAAVTDQGGSIPKCTVGVVACAVIAAAVSTAAAAVNYVGGVNVALAVNAFVWKYGKFWSAASTVETQRQTEAFVRELTTRLKAG